MAPIAHGQVSLLAAGWEASAIVPMDFIAEAHKAASPGLLIADVAYKGGIYVELTPTNQHVEYIYVNTIATEDYTAFCGAAYDVAARSNLSTTQRIVPGQCGPVPSKYRVMPGCRHIPCCCTSRSP